MIDFHSHVLPSMDDGSQSVEESKQMLEEMQKQGVDIVVATPHFDMRQEGPDEFLLRRKQAMEMLAEVIPTDTQVIVGAEVLYCGVPLHTLDQLEQLCIGNTRYLLIETIIQEWADDFYSEMQYLMLQRNITPILAHMERYYFIGKNREMIHRLNDSGVVLQMNAEAFLKPGMSRKALKILKREPIRLLGSDCHNTSLRPPNLREACERIGKAVGQERVDSIMTYAYGILAD